MINNFLFKSTIFVILALLFSSTMISVTGYQSPNLLLKEGGNRYFSDGNFTPTSRIISLGILNSRQKSLSDSLYGPNLLSSSKSVPKQITIQTSEAISSSEPTPIPTSTPFTTKTLLITGGESAFDAAGAIFGGFVAILIISFGVFILIKGIYLIQKKSEKYQSKQLIIQAQSLLGNDFIEDMDLLVSVQKTFSKLRQDIKNDFAMLQGRIDYRGYLPRFYLREEQFFSFDKLTDAAGLNFDALSQSSSPRPEDVKLRLTIGPFELQNLSPWLIRLFKDQPYLLFVNLQPNPPGKILITFILHRGDKVPYSNTFNILKTERKEIISLVAREVAWVMGHEDSKEVGSDLSTWPAEIELTMGIHLLVQFMHNPTNTKLLEKAQYHFDEATYKDENWSFQSRLLSLISQMLTKSKPTDTAEKFIKLADDYSKDRDKRPILSYYVGQALFYQYSKEGYPDAINSFKKVKRPYEFLWKYLRPMWWEVLKISNSKRMIQEYFLYSLSQCGIAITKAHQIKRRDETTQDIKNNKQLEEEINIISNSILEEANVAAKIIGQEISEIQWRALNAKLMAMLRLRKNFDEARKVAEEGLRIAPYALDLKENLGSLDLMIASQKFSTSEDILAIDEFIKAKDIYRNIGIIGYDLGFVKYRLGMISRVEGHFKEAIQILEEAKNPDIIDVPYQSIEIQISKARAGDATLAISDVY